jgi:preprotein translocase subunit SecE
MAKVQQPAVKEQNGIVRGVVNYYRETVGELKKVVWPTREEAIRLTSIVLVVITVMAIVLGTFDFLFAQLVRFLISL